MKPAQATTCLQRLLGALGDEPTLPDDAAGRLKLLEEKQLEKEVLEDRSCKGAIPDRSVGWAGPL